MKNSTKTDPAVIEKKWRRLRRRVGVFRHLPCIDFVIVAGSMAMGTARENSDFDVILGVRKGRMFTVRFLSVCVLEVLGWRKGKNEYNEKDKICLNHFVTEERYKLNPPYNAYWDALYTSLVPVWGDTEKIVAFFAANGEWMQKPRESVKVRNKRFILTERSAIGRFAERLLAGGIGDALERRLKAFQLVRIQAGLQAEAGYAPRIEVSDAELEFHPDTHRIEEMLAKRLVS